MAVAVSSPAVPVSRAETSSPALTPPMPCARPVIVVAPVTAAVTEGPSPPMVIDVGLTARTRPVRATRSCSGQADADAEAETDADADALGSDPATAVASGVPLIR